MNMKGRFITYVFNNISIIYTVVNPILPYTVFLKIQLALWYPKVTNFMWEIS
jgi:hypothetical protein